jgi:hypothetical protein
MADFAALADRQPARYFHFKARDLEIIFYTIGIVGAYMSVKDAHGERTYAGSQIRQEDTSIGTLLTVTRSVIADGDSHSLSLVLPTVNLPESGTVKGVGAVAIQTTHRSSFGGPGLLDGAVELYKTVAVKGTVSAGIPRDG